MTDKSNFRPHHMTALLRHAFLSGRGLGDDAKLSSDDVAAWVAYDPTTLPVYQLWEATVDEPAFPSPPPSAGADAVAAEREACAVLVDTMARYATKRSLMDDLHKVSDVIRARSALTPAPTPVEGDKTWSPRAEAIRLLAEEDRRQSQLLELLETIREQIRNEVKPESRPEGLFKNIQDAVYALRGRMPLLNDAAIMAPLCQQVKVRGLYPAPTPVEAGGEAVAVDGKRIAGRVLQRILDFDDRTSPEDQPEMLLVTGQELTDLIEEEIAETAIARGPLQKAEADFEAIRLILINELNEPVRRAFWRAVSARDAVRAALSPAAQAGTVAQEGER